MTRNRVRGRVVAGVVLVATLAGATILTAVAAPAGPAEECRARLLVLSAYPGEIDALLTQTDVSDVVAARARTFYVGTLRGNDVVLALTGIGLVNATRTTRAALETFRCDGHTTIAGMVFSGVAGGRSFIGDVTVPARWTADDGATWTGVDPEMLATAREAIDRGIRLARRVPLGDAACVGVDPTLVRAFDMPRAPRIIVGGDGKSADPFGGRTWPCVPGAGDVFGCAPCRAPVHRAPNLRRTVRSAAPFADPEFFLSFFSSPPPSTTASDAEDMETAAVARVAAANGIPFIAFRAMSDGRGDPLHLPGFPAQFFVYRALAAENASTVALAFLEAWAARGAT